MLKPSLYCVCLLGLVFGATACREDAVKASAHGYLRAIQYRDAAGVYPHHVESTAQATYCASMPFHRVLDRVRKKKLDAKSCAQARQVTASLSQPNAAVDNETQMLFQVIRFVCEQPQGSCRDYGKLVFSQQLVQSGLWKTPMTGYRIQKIERRKGDAVVYVDVDFDAPKRTRHHALHLRLVEGHWVVSDSLLTWDSVIK